MADSNITKRALGNALKALMKERPFEKINVAHICERCGMSRKSFYYHFRDKYDLMNWIFDMEFIALANDSIHVSQYDARWGLVEQACEYFYQNREFYRRALAVEGQNSLADHIQEVLAPLLKVRIVASLGAAAGADEFAVKFLTDASFCAIKRWLLDKNCMPPKQFVAKLRLLVERSAAVICQKADENKQK